MRSALLPFLVLSGLITAGCGGPAVRPSSVSGSGSGGGDGGLRVLSVGRSMVDRGEILPGSCWDYINTVYKRAGFPEARRKYVYRTKKKGPYADINLIRPGDWVYFVNHSYGDIEHSSIFVQWTNRGKKVARMLSYGGEKRRAPGRYLDYDLDSVFAIIRPE